MNLIEGQWASDLEAAVSAASVVRRAWEANPDDEAEQAMTFTFQFVVFLWLSHDADAKVAWIERHADRHAVYLARILSLYAEASSVDRTASIGAVLSARARAAAVGLIR